MTGQRKGVSKLSESWSGRGSRRIACKGSVNRRPQPFCAEDHRVKLRSKRRCCQKRCRRRPRTPPLLHLLHLSPRPVLRKYEGTAHSVQAHLIGGGCAADTANMEMVRRLRREIADLTICRPLMGGATLSWVGRTGKVQDGRTTKKRK